MQYTITCTTPISHAVTRLEGTAVNGAFLVVDVVTRLFDEIAVGTKLDLELGSHTKSYDMNAQVVSAASGCILASYGGLLLRVDHGIVESDMPFSGAILKASLSSANTRESNKRARCVAYTGSDCTHSINFAPPDENTDASL